MQPDTASGQHRGVEAGINFRPQDRPDRAEAGHGQIAPTVDVERMRHSASRRARDQSSGCSHLHVPATTACAPWDRDADGW